MQAKPVRSLSNHSTVPSREVTLWATRLSSLVTKATICSANQRSTVWTSQEWRFGQTASLSVCVGVEDEVSENKISKSAGVCMHVCVSVSVCESECCVRVCVCVSVCVCMCVCICECLCLSVRACVVYVFVSVCLCESVCCVRAVSYTHLRAHET